MKISSDDRKAWIEFVRNDDADPYSGHWVRMVVSTPAGDFSGSNRCVYFSDFRGFLSVFSQFVRTRNGIALLEMSEDCHLEFFRWNAKGDVGIRATISQWQRCGDDPSRPAPLQITGTFKLDAEMLNSVERDFLTIEKGEPSGTKNSGVAPRRV